MRLRDAVVLGALHGPAELAPVSSSAHTTLLPWLWGWDRGALDAPARKRFEVALHAGAVAALLVARRDAPTRRPGAPLTIVALACAPAVLAGAALHGAIERRAGTPATIAAGLAGGAALMAVGEHRGGRSRHVSDARALDGLALGTAQALALVPGVSRSGATRAAARWRGFGRAAARQLSDEVGLPITLAAVALEGAG